MNEFEVKSAIRAVLISAARPLTIDELSKDFRGLNGEPIPYGVLGYESLQSFLKHIPDVVRVEGYGRQAMLYPVTTAANRHVSDLVQKQVKPSGAKVRNTGYGRQQQQQRRNNNGGGGRNRRYRDLEDDDWEPRRGYVRPPPGLGRAGREEGAVALQPAGFEDDETDEEEEELVEEERLEVKEEGPKVESDEEMEKGAKPSLNRIMSHLKIKDRVRNLRNPVPQVDENAVSEKVPEPQKEEEVDQDNWNPPHRYKFIPPILKKVAPHEICQEPTPIENGSNEPETRNPFAASVNFSNCVKDASTIVLEDAFHAFSSADFVPIRVMELYSPYKFWFTLYHNEAKLVHLQKELNEFYNQIEDSDYYIVPEANAACAVRCKGIWYRAEIAHDIRDKYGMIVVFLFDYGSVIKVNPRYVKALLKRFSRLPRQAVRGRLAYVKPAGLKWTLEAVHVFKELVDVKVLFGCSEKTCTRLNMHYMSIVDTSHAIDLNISESMVKLNVAEKADLDGMDTVVLKYPTFKMIESGMCTPIVD